MSPQVFMQRLAALVQTEWPLSASTANWQSRP
jgi:hypothetical protein